MLRISLFWILVGFFAASFGCFIFNEIEQEQRDENEKYSTYENNTYTLEDLETAFNKIREAVENEER